MPNDRFKRPAISAGVSQGFLRDGARPGCISAAYHAGAVRAFASSRHRDAERARRAPQPTLRADTSDQDNKEATGIYAREMTKRERGGC